MNTYDKLADDYASTDPHSSFGARIVELIETKGISKSWIAEQLGISRQAFNYLLKHTAKPKFVSELSQILDVNPEWLEKGRGTKGKNKNLNTFNVNKIPVFNHKDLEKQPTKKTSSNYIAYTCESPQQYLALVLRDHSNFPPFIPGSILIFNKDKKPADGDYVLIMLENKIYVRQLILDGDNQCFKASNNEYKTFINPACDILGVLIESRYQIN